MLTVVQLCWVSSVMHYAVQFLELLPLPLSQQCFCQEKVTPGFVAADAGYVNFLQE